MRLVCLGLIFGLGLFVSGCATTTQIPISEVPMGVLGYNSNPDLCLALSGGGLRSAVLSLGALQQLEKNGLLKQIGLVGSVSGGGWPLYGR